MTIDRVNENVKGNRQLCRKLRETPGANRVNLTLFWIAYGRALRTATVPTKAISEATSGCHVETVLPLMTPLDTSAVKAATTTPFNVEN